MYSAVSFSSQIRSYEGTKRSSSALLPLLEILWQMEAKIGKFFESVGSFFTGGDHIPWSDGDIVVVSISLLFELIRALFVWIACYFFFSYYLICFQFHHNLAQFVHMYGHTCCLSDVAELRVLFGVIILYFPFFTLFFQCSKSGRLGRLVPT